MSETCQALTLAELILYERRELEPAEIELVEEPSFACADCTKRLEFVVRLGRSVDDLVRHGLVSASVTAELVATAEEQGVRLRTYRMSPGQQVACTASPSDDLVVIRLGMVVDESESVDIAFHTTYIDTGETESRIAENVSVDRSSGEAIYVYSGDLVRSLPRIRSSMRALIRKAESTRELGPYVLDHTPWNQLVNRS
jgi:hypothetical protein